MSNNSDMFGGVSPSNWSNNNYRAADLSSDKARLTTLFNRRGYKSRNGDLMVTSDGWTSHDTSDSSKFAGALFRIKNTTNAPITWRVRWYYTSYSSWSNRASLAVNGEHIWDGSNEGPGSNRTDDITIPADRTSTVIFISSSYRWDCGYHTCRWQVDLGFYENSLNLPDGLEYVDDMDIAENGWDK